MGKPHSTSQPTRPTRTSQDFQEAAKHVRYEIDMLRETANGLAKDIADLITKNAYVESFAIHARGLIDFFFPGQRPPYPDDILAVDFFDSPAQWTGAYLSYPCPPAHLEAIRQKVHKRVAHLTYERISLQVDWAFVEIKDQIEAVFADFLARQPRQTELSTMMPRAPLSSGLAPTIAVASTTVVTSIAIGKTKSNKP